MDLPVALPHHLASLKNIENENEMLKVLVNEPTDLIAFFESACSDTAWSVRHQTVMSKILVWMTYQFFHGALAVEIAERVQKQVFEHYALIGELLPKDIAVVSDEKTYSANSLMFGMSSSVLLGYLREECVEKEGEILEITDASNETVEAAIEYIHSGEVENLWKKDWSLVLKILREAADWEMEGLVDFCARIYKRYLNRGNAVNILEMAHQNGWYELKKGCFEFINQQNVGVSFQDDGVDELTLNFHRYSKEAMEMFHRLSGEVTFLGFDYELIENSSFTEVITHVPLLKGVNLQNTRHYSERLKGIPENIDQLDLSMCEWLNEETLVYIIETCPFLKVLKLNSNVQLDYHSWSQLHTLDNLEHLEVSRCNQMGDDDFLVIIRGCPHLRRLCIEGCHRLTDDSLVELSLAISTLVSVDFSRTGATDAVITELAYRNRQLRELKLERCTLISDHGIMEVVKLAPNLKLLDLTGSSISSDAKNRLLSINQHLRVI
jgi:BTB/POZ domain